LRTGAEILLEGLKRMGVDLVFGYPGGAVLPLYDALYDFDLRHILARHEQGAVHAADGYARATGKVGVCFATSGPGATNLVTGIANAYMDSVPLVIITGQVATGLLGTDAFQEADITGITLPITKHSYLVKKVEELPRIIMEAFHIASAGRPGPVLIDLPKDVQTATTAVDFPEKIRMVGYKPTYQGHPKQIQVAVEAIQTAQRPVIMAGGGVAIARAEEELVRFAELLNAPVVTTLMGLGSIPGNHPLNLGMLGMHGTVPANYAVTECDLLITIGARFDDRVTGDIAAFAPQAKIIHADIDPAEIGKNVRIDIPIVGDAKNVLQALQAKLQPGEAGEDWWKQVEDWKESYPLIYKREGKLKPQFVVEEICRLTKGEALITTEVGQNQMWAAQYFKYNHPHQLITSGGLGTMGYGFPAAIGAQAGCPDRVVFDIAGDGSIQMNIQELATAVSYNLPVKIAILNNGYLGMVRQWQEMFFNRRYSSTTLQCNPDFVKLAEAYGAKGIRVQESAEVERAIREALDTPGPVILDFIVDAEENVFPMVPAGAGLHQVIRGEGE
jgi:acetolactate synthase-1/2/3 large subunit